MEVNLAQLVPNGARVLIDTNPIIYLLEASPLSAHFEPLFADIEQGRVHAIVTPITIAEVASGPLKHGKDELAERYRRALVAGSGWTLRELDDDIAMIAARIRVRHRLKLPDALQLATAIHEGCFALVTHDRDFSSIDDVPILGM